ncbi:hypothetical protein SAMN05660862_3315, partial [Sphingobacterium psychroaquaticum]
MFSDEPASDGLFLVIPALKRGLNPVGALVVVGFASTAGLSSLTGSA